MRALVYTGPYAAELRELPMPEPQPDEVLIRIAACGICGSDMHAYHGQDERRPPPLVLGHEAAGTVASGPMQGQRVTLNPLVIPEDCPTVALGRPHLSPRRMIISMPQRPGAFAEYATIPARNLLPIPETMPFSVAALAEPLAVSWHAVSQGLRLLGQAPQGVRALVLGGGAIGLGAALVLRAKGVAEIALAEPNAIRRETAREAGDFLVYAPGSKEEPADGSVDLVIDAVGAAQTRAAASRLVRPGGVIVHAGLLPGHDGLDIRRITLQEIIVTGTYCYTPDDFRETVDALVAGRFGALTWVETRPLAAGPQAFADIDAGRVRAAKIVLEL